MMFPIIRTEIQKENSTKGNAELKLIRITTVPLSLKYLLKGQLRYFKEKGNEILAVSSDDLKFLIFLKRKST